MKTQKSIRKFLVAVGVMFAGAAVGAVVWGGPMVAGFSPDNGRTATVRIPADASFDELTDSLKASLGDKHGSSSELSLRRLTGSMSSNAVLRPIVWHGACSMGVRPP